MALNQWPLNSGTGVLAYLYQSSLWIDCWFYLVAQKKFYKYDGIFYFCKNTITGGCNSSFLSSIRCEHLFCIDPVLEDSDNITLVGFAIIENHSKILVCRAVLKTLI